MGFYTIIVPDQALLARVCGTNDINLKLIENFMGLPVFARGNEISVESDDSSVEQQFRFIINRILDEISEKDGHITDSELIESVLNNDSSAINDGAFFNKYSITVPGGTKKIYPRTRGQAVLVKSMRDRSMVFATGPAGTGKTFMAVAESLRLLLSHQVSSIILMRPVVEAGESLGFLPGDLNEKINPYIRPLYDAMNALLPPNTVKKLTENGNIEVAPLAYMRGRTLSNSAIILDEAQNTTVEQMKMFLTRMGENSRVFVTGDPEQVDLPRRIQSGLTHAVKILENIEGISVVKLTADDVVRNELVKKIIQAYENEERQ